MLRVLRTDAGLVAQAMAGRAQSFDELVRRHFNVVYGIAFSYTHNHADAEDLSQEAFLKAYQSLDTLQEPKKFGHWVGVITRNLARNWYQRRRRETDALGQVLAQVSPRTDAAYDDMREVLEQQIHALDPIPREVLMLHYFSGKSTAEIAKAMGVSQAAVLKRLQRAREALGVKLIHELKLIPTAEQDSAKHRRMIMSAIAATGLTWNMTGTGWASVAAGSLMSGKVIATAILVTGAVTAAVQELALEAEESDSEARGDERELEVFDDTISAVQVVEPEMVLAAVIQEEDESDAETAEVVDPNAGMPSLEGDWRVYGAQEGAPMEELGIVHLDRDGEILSVEGQEGISYLTATGTVRGTIVALEMFLNENADEGPQPFGEMEGDFFGDFRELALSGTLLEPGSGEPLQLQLRMKRMSESEQSREEAIAEAREKLQAIQQAIIKFMKEQGASPAALSDLLPLYLSDSSLIAEVQHETLSYTPMAHEWLDMRGSINPTDHNKWPALRNFRETGNPGFLVDLEEDLTAAWGDYFPRGHTLLRLENEKHVFALEAGDGGTIKEAIYGEADRYADGRTNTQKPVMRASCANNLKQLGLSFKMFGNETKGEYFPGGFRQVYPEYLPDLAILTCPGGPIGELSYTILFPATNRSDWLAIYSAVYGPSEEELNYGLIQSKIPLIMDIDECSGSGGRNVLFIDGHVEYVLNRDYDTVIRPFLNVNF
jgi:RNA polymerase sigma-70 factor (ECF subfamily)